MKASATIGTGALLHFQLPRGKGALKHCPLFRLHDGRALLAGKRGENHDDPSTAWFCAHFFGDFDVYRANLVGRGNLFLDWGWNGHQKSNRSKVEEKEHIW